MPADGPDDAGDLDAGSSSGLDFFSLPGARDAS
jgi:hypothetical protein